MYELETLAGPVFSVDAGLAEALAEALDAEMHARTESFYTAVLAGAPDVPVFAPLRVVA
ncbi:MAG TPA: hypothetical protein VNA14_01140 [Mycobacteriales bacterium]|nr:hypothetical protein [Mycobacteriales bacterium]